MSKYHNRWSEAERLIARRLLADGAPEQAFIDATGRSRKAALAHVRQFDHPRDRSLDQSRIDRKRSIPNSRGNVPVPEAVLEDAARRIAANRSITAYVFGDPAPGQSALDKREARL